LALVVFAMAGLSCHGRSPSPEERAHDVASWLSATSGVVKSWVGGSISAAAAESNLESTARTIADLSREGLPESMAQRLRGAQRLVAEAHAAVRAGDKGTAAAKATDIAALARALGSSASGVQ
jgi:hypothetical protein